MKKVSIITVNYNHGDVTEALLDSVFCKNTYPSLEVIVVDNGSKENLIPLWNFKYPQATFLRSEQNLGFAGGNNIGIRAATGDYLFLVNNDTEITEGLIEQLVATLDKDANTGVVSPKIRYYDQPDTLQYAGYTHMNYFTCRNACIGQFEKDQGQYDDCSGVTGFAHGAAMMLRREVVDKAGLMAENFFLYYEEMDWCEQIRRAGYAIQVNLKAVIYHKESVSVGKASALKEYFMNRNRLLFIRRNAPFFHKAFFYPYFLFIVTPRNIARYISSKNYHFIPLLCKAITWNLSNKTNSRILGFPSNK